MLIRKESTNDVKKHQSASEKDDDVQSNLIVVSNEIVGWQRARDQSTFSLLSHRYLENDVHTKKNIYQAI